MNCTNCNNNYCGCPIRLSTFCVFYDSDKKLTTIPVNPGNNLQDILINLDSKLKSIIEDSVGQELSFNSSTNLLSISGGNGVTLPIPDNQTLSIDGFNLSLTNGGTVTLPQETVTTLVDNGGSFTYTNEQGIGTTVSISSGSVDVVSNVTQDRILGRVSVGSGNSEQLTATQVRTLINVEDGAEVNPTGAELESTLDTELVNTRWKVEEVPSGGTTNQVLKKNSNTDYDYSWQNDDTGGGGSLPSGVLDDLIYHNGTSFVKATPVVFKTTGLTGNTITLPSTPLTTNEFYFDLVVNTPRIEGSSPYDYTISGNTITTNFTLITSDNIRVKYIIA